MDAGFARDIKPDFRGQARQARDKIRDDGQKLG